MAIVRRPAVISPAGGIADVLILVALGGAAVQLVPLPVALRDLLSPAAASVHANLDLDAAAGPAFATLSLDPVATMWSLSTATACALIFWTAREGFEHSGIRRTVFGLACCGLLLGTLVFVQRAMSPHHIYGFWTPIARTETPTTPLGPFVNRNDLATWLLLAIPLVLGYAVARVAARATGRLALDVVSIADVRMVILAGSLLLMSGALVASLSRSGLIGLCAGLLMMGTVGRRRLGSVGRGALASATFVLLVTSLQYANVSAVAARLGGTLSDDVGGRVAIWRQAWAMARDFIVAGVGVGAFERGMLVYQQGSRVMFVNHAHNEYLQILTEGGLLVGGAALSAVGAAIWTASRLLRSDGTRTFWIRAGAMSGLLAVGIQSIWDTGLRMPANGVLFALLAAIALHEPEAAIRGRGKSPGAHPPGGSTPAARSAS